MIDLILWGATKADFRTFAIANNLLLPVDDGEGGTTYVQREGFTFCWWAGSGRLMTARGEYDSDGNEIAAPNYLNGFVALLRIHGDFFKNDRLEAQEENPEQWQRSKIARYIKNNGTQGSIAGITYYELDGVRLFRAGDVQDWLSANDLPGHEWQGGNRF